MRWPRPFLTVLLVITVACIPVSVALADDGGGAGKEKDAAKTEKDKAEKDKAEKDKAAKDKAAKDKATQDKQGNKGQATPTSDLTTADGQSITPAAGALPSAGPPVLGRAVAVAPVSGEVRVRLPGASSFVVLSQLAQVPTGSTIDTSNGTVSLTSAHDAKGAEQSATFTGATFRVTQPRKTRPVTDLDLRDGNFTQCKRSSGVRRFATAARSGAVRRLWGSGHGRFRTRGRYGSATVRGTVWLTEDRCDGTRVRVARGLVAVRDNVRHKTVMVPAGHSYLARAQQ